MYLIVANDRIPIFRRIQSTTSFSQKPFDTGKPLTLSKHKENMSQCADKNVTVPTKEIFNSRSQILHGFL